MVVPHRHRRRAPFADEGNFQRRDDPIVSLGATIGPPIRVTKIDNAGRPRTSQYPLAPQEYVHGYHHRRDGLLQCQCWCQRNVDWITPGDVFNGRTYICEHPECAPGGAKPKPKPKPKMKPPDYDPSIFDPPCPTCGAPPRRRCRNSYGDHLYGLFYVHAKRRATHATERPNRSSSATG